MKKTAFLSSCVVAALSSAPAVAACTRSYVDVDASGGDGSSWANAYDDLQDALTASPVCDEIWVAEGIYEPTSGSSRSISFQLVDGTEMYGGFKGDETSLSERNIELCKTVLSGDLDGDDIPVNFQNNDENSYHVVNGTGVGNTTILDGFFITGGNATVDCSASIPLGVNNLGGGLLVRNTTFGTVSGSPVIRNCTFFRNQACIGGGANVIRSQAKFEDTTFWLNRAFVYGGGLYNTGHQATSDEFADIVVDGCRFVENSSYAWGGGSCSAMSDPLYVNCEFTRNYIDRALNSNLTFKPFGGGLSIGCTSNCGDGPKVINCSFVRNLSTYDDVNDDQDGFGGGLNMESGTTVEIHNCMFWENESSVGIDEDAQINVESGSVTVTYSNIDGLVCPGGSFCGDDNIDVVPDFVLAYYGDLHLFDNVRMLSGSLSNDAGNNNRIPSGITEDYDGLDRTLDDADVTDTGNGAGDIVDIGAFELSDLPYLLTDGVAGTSFTDHSFSRFIDTRMESNNGSTQNMGMTEFTLVFSEQVRDIDQSGSGAALSPTSIYVLETGLLSPPTVVCTSIPVDQPFTDSWQVQITLSRPATVAEWTSIVANVEDMDDNLIIGTDRIVFGFLPGDLKQDADIEAADLLRIKQYLFGTNVPADFGLPGTVEDYADIDRSGVNAILS